MMKSRNYVGKCRVDGCQHYSIYSKILTENGMDIFKWKCWFHAPCVGPEYDAKLCPKCYFVTPYFLIYDDDFTHCPCCHYPMNKSSAVKTAIALGTLDVFKLMAQNMGHVQSRAHIRQWTSLAENITGGISGGDRRFCWGCGKVSCAKGKAPGQNTFGS
eukprot:5150733-Karenia_brevis.AAC.1